MSILRDSEEQFRVMVAAALDAFVMMDGSGHIRFFNPAAEKMFGYSAAEAQGQDLHHLLAPAQFLPAFHAAFPHFQATGQGAAMGRTLTLAARRKDGTEFPVELALGPIHLQGEWQAVGVIRDLSARQQAETALRHSETKFRTLYVSTSDAVMLLDEKGIFDCNPAALIMFGCATREEFCSKHPAELSPPVQPDGTDSRTLADRRIATALEKGSHHFECVHKRADTGQTFPAEVLLSAMELDGQPVLQATVRDITARRQTEAALRLRDAALQAAANVIVMTDRQGNIIWVNAAFTRMTGYTAEEALGGNPRVLRSGQHDDGFYRNLWETIQAGHVWQGEIINKRKDGSLFTEEATITPVCDAVGSISHFIAVKQDITERKLSEVLLKQTSVTLEETNAQLEEAIERANQLALQAELANCAKSEFLATMSHEIRTPMNGVLGMVGLLLDTALTPEQRELAELAHNSGEALMTVINDILDFAKMEAHKLDLESLAFDLRTTLEDAVNLLAVRAQAKGLELICLMAPNLPLLLRGDPGRLRQILMNLVGNAVKFTPRGEVAIHASLEAETESKVTLRFTVTDTGVGIPASRIKALFAPFVQADSSTTREYGGTGLGLAISKQLVELMGGRIGVESVQGKGATFWFTVPLAKQPASVVSDPKPADGLAGVNVLVVDDNATARLAVSTLLRAWACRCTEAVGGESALAALRVAAQGGDPFQIALLDAQMPGMDGEELARRIKQDVELQPTALILMTLLGQLGKADPGTALRLAGSLPKPIQQIPLRNLMARVLVPTSSAASLPVELGSAPTAPPRASHGKDLVSPIRILLAEDNRTNQAVALAVLQRLGYHADAVANGMEALAALRQTPYDLVLMDCQMPEVDGYEATRRIRQPGSGVLNPLIPVIAMTAHALQGAQDKCLRAGMNDYVSKPIDKGLLSSALKRWLPQPEEPTAELPPATGIPIVDDPQASPAPIFDSASLLDRLQGDAGMARIILAGFLGDIPKQLRLLQECLDQASAPGVERQAHTIKGAATTVGASALAALAATVESAAEQGDLTRAASLLPGLAEQFAQLQATLRQSGWA